MCECSREPSEIAKCQKTHARAVRENVAHKSSRDRRELAALVDGVA
jgi:hypothetical protein